MHSWRNFRPQGVHSAHSVVKVIGSSAHRACHDLAVLLRHDEDGEAVTVNGH
jgi:hypothetical protein